MNVILIAAIAALAATDAELAGVIRAVNETELQAARLAQGKAQDPEVKAFARHMLQEHGENGSRLNALQLPVRDSPDARRIRDKAGKDLAELKPLGGEEFDRAYVRQQVAAHHDVFQLLLRAAQTPRKDAKVAQHLTETQQTVQRHLELARQLQKRFNK